MASSSINTRNTTLAGEGQHADLLNRAPVSAPPLDSGASAAAPDNLKLRAIFAAGFALLLDFVFRITEASEDRIYESGDRKISE